MERGEHGPLNQFQALGFTYRDAVKISSARNYLNIPRIVCGIVSPLREVNFETPAELAIQVIVIKVNPIINRFESGGIVVDFGSFPVMAFPLSGCSDTWSNRGLGNRRGGIWLGSGKTAVMYALRG